MRCRHLKVDCLVAPLDDLVWSGVTFTSCKEYITYIAGPTVVNTTNEPTELSDSNLKLPSGNTSLTWDAYVVENQVHEMNVAFPVSSPIYDSYKDEDVLFNDSSQIGGLELTEVQFEEAAPHNVGYVVNYSTVLEDIYGYDGWDSVDSIEEYEKLQKQFVLDNYSVAKEFLHEMLNTRRISNMTYLMTKLCLRMVISVGYTQILLFMILIRMKMI